MELYPKEANCPHCGVRGEIRHVPAEVVPRRAFCGNCQVVFDYPVNRYDHILQDYDGDLNVFFFDPHWRTKPEPPAPPPEPEVPLIKRLSTADLLGALWYARIHGAQPEYGQPFEYDELKDELATREHIPNKKQAKELRRKKAQEHHGSKKR